MTKLNLSDGCYELPGGTRLNSSGTPGKWFCHIRGGEIWSLDRTQFPGRLTDWPGLPVDKEAIWQRKHEELWGVSLVELLRSLEPSLDEWADDFIVGAPE